MSLFLALLTLVGAFVVIGGGLALLPALFGLAIAVAVLWLVFSLLGLALRLIGLVLGGVLCLAFGLAGLLFTAMLGFGLLLPLLLPLLVVVVLVAVLVRATRPPVPRLAAGAPPPH